MLSSLSHTVLPSTPPNRNASVGIMSFSLPQTHSGCEKYPSCCLVAMFPVASLQVY